MGRSPSSNNPLICHSIMGTILIVTCMQQVRATRRAPPRGLPSPFMSIINVPRREMKQSSDGKLGDGERRACRGSLLLRTDRRHTTGAWPFTCRPRQAEKHRSPGPTPAESEKPKYHPRRLGLQSLSSGIMSSSDRGAGGTAEVRATCCHAWQHEFDVHHS